MGKFLIKRIFHIILIFLLFISLTFIFFQLTPGDVTDKFVGNPNFSPEMVEKIKTRFGLNDPWYVQYVRYITNVFTGDLGVSFSQYPTPVWEILKQRIPRTLLLFLTSRLVSFYIGFFLGKIIAWKRNSIIDTGTTIVGITFWTMFYPLLAIINIWFFGYLLGWVPLSGFSNPYLWMDSPSSITINNIFGLIIFSGFIFILLWILARQIAKKINVSTKVKKGIIYLTPLLLFVIIIVSWIISGYGVYAWDIIYHMILPVVTLALISFGGTMLLTRDSMMETIQKDYVRVARAKGLPDKKIRDKYAARTALLPVVTSLTLSLGFFFSGGIVT